MDMSAQSGHVPANTIGSGGAGQRGSLRYLHGDPGLTGATSTVSIAESSVIDDAWLSLLELSQRCDGGRLAYCAVFKRLIDVTLASLALTVLSPLLLVVAFAIRLDSQGPMLFRQTRVGRGGRPFVVYKFRTMIQDRRKEQTPFDGVDRRRCHKTPNDPRLTRLGKFLRRTSIDELPQLINVVRGEMSLVGPRPELPEITERYAAWQHRRHLVRPGLTGWWQVQGRSDLPMHENTELDLYYVEHVSFRLDLRIVLRTVRVVLGGFGAF